MLTGAKARYDKLQSLGCYPCRLLGYVNQPADMHHLLSGSHRIGDAATVPCCEWHHRGVWNTRFKTRQMAEKLLGPSLALNPKRFREAFGDDNTILEKVNELIK